MGEPLKRGDFIVHSLRPDFRGIVIDVWKNSDGGLRGSVIWETGTSSPASLDADAVYNGVRLGEPFSTPKFRKALAEKLRRDLESIDAIRARAEWLQDFLDNHPIPLKRKARR